MALGRDDLGDREPQRVLGMPVGGGSGRRLVEDTEQRVLGVPSRLLPEPPERLVALVHPLLWLRWRRRVRDGSVDASFGDFQRELLERARSFGVHGDGHGLRTR